MATHKPFRELINPKSNFDFIGRVKTWAFISFLLVSGSIGMLFVNKSVRGDYLNWTIDFKGGTEIIFSFADAGDGSPAGIGSGDVRDALSGAGKSGVDISDFTWKLELPDGSERDTKGIIVRTQEFGAVNAEQREVLRVGLMDLYKDSGISSARWSGDRVFVRSLKPIDWESANQFFADSGLELKAWDALQKEQFQTPVEGVAEYNGQLSIKGIGVQYQKLLQDALGEGIKVNVVQVDGVGAKAGAQLRNDGIKSLFYVMALIMLYLAFRFDVRYAPGAVVALLHDAILVVGVFAVAWTPVSLTTVAALLTVMGYSVNDSVVIFDRIRENVGRLKDKKFGRIINISLNETMARTLMTSITLFVVTLMMNIFGTGLVRNFAFAMNIGVIVGVYSSVFIASPIALAIHNKWFKGSGKSSRAAKSPASAKPKAKKPTIEPDRKKSIDDDDDDDDDGGSAEGTAKRKPPAKKKRKKRR